MAIVGVEAVVVSVVVFAFVAAVVVAVVVNCSIMYNLEQPNPEIKEDSQCCRSRPRNVEATLNVQQQAAQTLVRQFLAFMHGRENCMLLLSPCDDKELCQRRPPVPVTNAAYQRISPETWGFGMLLRFGVWDVGVAVSLPTC